MKKRPCELKGCDNWTENGGQVGYDIDGKQVVLWICDKHARIIASAPRGSYRITEDCRLVPILQRRIII